MIINANFLEYYVIIELYNHNTDDVIDSRVTSNQSGDSPVWNEALHFGLLKGGINAHYMELTGK